MFLLFGNGFSWENIYGLDLISYSPKIQLGDMHTIPFEENFFDVVICGWTLSYSAQPQLAANEMQRIVKNGGMIAIGVEYSTMTKEDTEYLLKYAIQEYDKLAERINSTGQILALFKNNVHQVFFDHDAPNKISHSRNGYADNVSNVVTIFSINK